MSPDKPLKSSVARLAKAGVLGILTTVGLIGLGILAARLVGPLQALHPGNLKWVGPVALLGFTVALFWVWHHWDAIIRGFHFTADQEPVWLAARHRLGFWTLGYCAMVAVFLLLR